MTAQATLQDVADRAGVHRSTVALALRDNPRISSATRQRVQAIARELGYQLNPLVAALMSARRSGNPLKHVTLGYVTNYPALASAGSRNTMIARITSRVPQAVPQISDTRSNTSGCGNPG